MVFLIVYLTGCFNDFYILKTKLHFVFMIFVLITSGYVFYRASIISQHRYGDLYKALFDIMRPKMSTEEIIDFIACETNLKYLKKLSPRQKNQAISRFLDWHKVKLSLNASNINFEKAV